MVDPNVIYVSLVINSTKYSAELPAESSNGDILKLVSETLESAPRRTDWSSIDIPEEGVENE